MGFILLTAYTGPLGAFLYVLGSREALPGLHERYVAARWRQVLGSTMHCVAGDRVGILAGEVIANGKAFYCAATTVGTSFCPVPPAPSRRPGLEAAVDYNAVNVDVIPAGPCVLRSA